MLQELFNAHFAAFWSKRRTHHLIERAALAILILACCCGFCLPSWSQECSFAAVAAVAIILCKYALQPRVVVRIDSTVGRYQGLNGHVVLNLPALYIAETGYFAQSPTGYRVAILGVYAAEHIRKGR
jgi:hypothetical protein